MADEAPGAPPPAEAAAEPAPEPAQPERVTPPAKEAAAAADEPAAPAEDDAPAAPAEDAPAAPAEAAPAAHEPVAAPPGAEAPAAAAGGVTAEEGAEAGEQALVATEGEGEPAPPPALEAPGAAEVEVRGAEELWELEAELAADDAIDQLLAVSELTDEDFERGLWGEAGARGAPAEEAAGTSEPAPAAEETSAGAKKKLGARRKGAGPAPKAKKKFVPRVCLRGGGMKPPGVNTSHPSGQSAVEWRSSVSALWERQNEVVDTPHNYFVADAKRAKLEQIKLRLAKEEAAAAGKQLPDLPKKSPRTLPPLDTSRTPRGVAPNTGTPISELWQPRAPPKKKLPSYMAPSERETHGFGQTWRSRQMW